ncbi:MAG: chemotaxis protein CheB [Terriglobia bacterium]
MKGDCKYDSYMFPSVHSALRRRFSLVVVTGSAGGIEALLRLVDGVPSGFPIPIVIAQHLQPEYPSCLVNVLQKRTEMRVCWAEDGQRLVPETIFVGPPGHHVLVSGRQIVVVSVRGRVRNGQPSGDLLLASAALSFGTEAVGIVLSGSLSDGASGVQILQSLGGVVIVQDPKSAVISGMPEAAIRTGSVDFVLPLLTVPAALTTLVMQPGAAEFFCGSLASRAASLHAGQGY